MEIERNLGTQPLAELMAKFELKAHDLVAASGEQLTHKLISRAAKGRRLTDRSKAKVMRAFNLATGKSFETPQLFNY